MQPTLAAAFLIAAFLVAGCTSTAPAGTGVQGIVLVGPTCPVERNPPDPSCAPKPLATNLVLLRADSGATVKEFSSGDDGKFQVAVAPGNYKVEAAPGGPVYPRCEATAAFSVAAGAYTNVTVQCDSGIR